MINKILLLSIMPFLFLPAAESGSVAINYNAWHGRSILFENAEIELFFKEYEGGIKMVFIQTSDKGNIGTIIFKENELDEIFIAVGNKMPVSVKGKMMEINGIDYVVSILINKDGVIARECINSDPIFIPQNLIPLK